MPYLTLSRGPNRVHRHCRKRSPPRCGNRVAEDVEGGLRANKQIRTIVFSGQALLVLGIRDVRRGHLPIPLTLVVVVVVVVRRVICLPGVFEYSLTTLWYLYDLQSFLILSALP